MNPTIRIGVVLSAGRVRGVYAHTGFLQAIESLDVPIAAILPAVPVPLWEASTLAVRHCPCGCQALIAAIEPELPYLPWPQTDLGPEVQAQAMNQVEMLLDPYIEDLLYNPDSLKSLVLPVEQSKMEGSRC